MWSWAVQQGALGQLRLWCSLVLKLSVVTVHTTISAPTRSHLQPEHNPPTVGTALSVQHPSSGSDCHSHQVCVSGMGTAKARMPPSQRLANVVSPVLASMVWSLASSRESTMSTGVMASSSSFAPVGLDSFLGFRDTQNQYSAFWRQHKVILSHLETWHVASCKPILAVLYTII